MSRQIYRCATAAVFGSFFLFQVGCNSKIDECNKVIEVVNQAVAEMGQAEAQVNSDDQAVMLAGADSLMKTADATMAKLSALTAKTPEVVKFSADYQKMMKDLSAVSAASKEQVTAASAFVKTIEESGKKVETNVAAYTAVCTSDATAAEECGKVGAIMEKMPDDPSADVAGFKSVVAELKGLAVSNPALKTAVAGVAAAFEGMGGALDGMLAVEKGIEANQKKAEALGASESTLIDGFNAFCQAP